METRINKMQLFSPHLLTSLCLTIAVAACNFDATAFDDIGPTILDGGEPDVRVEDVTNDSPDSSPDLPEPDAVADAQPDVEDTAADAEPDVGPPPSCESAAECNDGRACTEDICDLVAGHCTWAIADDACLIGGNCFAAGDVAPRNPCAICDPAAADTAWTPIAEGDPCDAGDICVVDAVCTDGACIGAELACEDGNPCTENTCVSGLGCDFPPAFDGESCDDGNACTDGDVCAAGSCEGSTMGCDDGNPCTDDACDPIDGCGHTDNTAACDDGDACTDGDVCAEGECISGEPANCEDGNLCTIDRCDEFVGCFHIPDLNPCCSGTTSICDDEDPCTTDICNLEDGSCSREPNTAACDDGNACTTRDTCDDGTCGGDEISCEDDNPCTAEFCDPEDGCSADLLTGVACDDGVDCTVDDVCVAGACVGTSECICEPTFGLQAVKLTSVQIGTGGRPGQALDLDADPATCAPATDCSDGLHNALGVIAGFANEPLADSVADGSLMLVLDIDDIALNPFEIALFQADLSPDDLGCDFATEVCDYVVDRATLDPETCEPLVTLDATRSGDAVFAGGPGTVFPFEIPLGDAVLAITLYDVRFEGDLTIVGDEVTALTGVIGGAVPRADLIDALEALPADALPLDPGAIVSLLELLVADDIDTDGDGEPDAASIGLPIVGIGAEVAGAL